MGLYFYFYEVNVVLDFECEMVYGKYLDILVGVVVWFEFGDKKEV